jgi:hypothetical protein
MNDVLTYIGRHGSKHLVLVRAHGSRGRALRYVSDAELAQFQFSAGEKP